MAVSLNGSDQYLYCDIPTGIIANECSLFCRFKSNSITAAQLIMSAGSTSLNDQHSLLAQGNVGGDPVRCNTRRAGFNKSASSSTGFSAGVWHSAHGWSDLPNIRGVRLDDGGEGTESTSGAGTSVIDRLYIGAAYYAGTGVTTALFDGLLEAAAFWNVILDPAVFTMMAAGLLEPHRAPVLPVAYFPLVDSGIDIIGGRTLVGVNSPGYVPGGPLSR